MPMKFLTRHSLCLSIWSQLMHSAIAPPCSIPTSLKSEKPSHCFPFRVIASPLDCICIYLAHSTSQLILQAIRSCSRCVHGRYRSVPPAKRDPLFSSLPFGTQGEVVTNHPQSVYGTPRLDCAWQRVYVTAGVVERCYRV